MQDAICAHQLVRATSEEDFNRVVASLQAFGLPCARLSTIFGAALDELRPDEPRYASCDILARYYMSLPQRVMPFHTPEHLLGFTFPA